MERGDYHLTLYDDFHLFLALPMEISSPIVSQPFFNLHDHHHQGDEMEKKNDQCVSGVGASEGPIVI